MSHPAPGGSVELGLAALSRLTPSVTDHCRLCFCFWAQTDQQITRLVGLLSVPYLYLAADSHQNSDKYLF